jgi:5,10-methylenetetrahydromethanopterin reductase
VTTFGVGLYQDYDPADLARIVRLLEELGYDTLWYGNEKFYRDPWIGLTLASTITPTLRLGTFIADPYTLHPALIAVAAATLDEVSNGRAVLLLGAGGTGLDRLGLARRKPVQALREAIGVIRPLLAGESVDFDGETVAVNGVRLAFSTRPDLPIYVAGRGDKVLGMAGEVADGAMIATYATPRGVAHALEQLTKGAERAGRSVGDLMLISRVDGWIDDDPERARDALRPMIARLLASSHPDRSFVDAVGVDIPAELQTVIQERNRDRAQAAAHLVSDELVDAFSWAGTGEQVLERVAGIAALGVSHVTFVPHPPAGRTVEEGIRAFARGVIEPLRRAAPSIVRLHEA